MSLTGNKVTDLQLLNTLSDKELLIVCQTNKTVRSTCEILYKNRIKKRNNLTEEEAIAQKDQLGFPTWTQYYIYLYH